MSIMSEVANGVEMSEEKSQTDEPAEKNSSKSDTPVTTTEEDASGSSKQCSSSAPKEASKEITKGRSAKTNSVDFVVISDDEGESSQTRPLSAVNGSCSPNGIQSVESENSDEVDLIGDYDDSEDNADDEIEITGVSIANNEFGTVGGMDQLLRTLINQGWTEAEIMSQLRGMIAPYQSRQRLSNFNSISDVVDCIKRVNKVIIVSGAGISVSCGIPDFRSETGLYARLSKEFPTLPNPTAMFDLNYFLDDPKPFFTFAKEIWPGQFKPSPCHRFIKFLESHGKLLRNYTQNIDTLEQVAGIENVIQCHGSFATASCIYCRYQVAGDDIKKDIMEGRFPLCPKCKELSLVEGKKAYLEFARKKYREIKKKLRRREKFSSSSSSSSSVSTTDDNAAISSKQNGKKRLESNDDCAFNDNPNESCDQPSSSKQVASTGARDSVETGGHSRQTVEQSTSAIEDESNRKVIAPSPENNLGSRKNDKEVESKDDSQPTNSKDQSSSSKDPISSVADDDCDSTTGSPVDDLGPPLDPILKPDIVFFGEDLPRNFFDHAEEDLEQAELIIVIGSSMKVKPVASIPEFVQERTPRVLINREPVRHISFDVQLLGDADEIVQQLCHKLEWESPVDESCSDKVRPHRPKVVPLEELTPLPTRQEIEGENSSSESDKSKPGTSSEKAVDEESSSKTEKSKEAGADKQEFEEPCPLFGVRCQCPVSWNIARFLPSDSVAKMQPNTFIFPGANVMHPKHVFTASNDLYTVESDSDLGGFENPIEVSSSEGSVHLDDEHITELSDAEIEDVSKSKSSEIIGDDNETNETDKAVSSKDQRASKSLSGDEETSGRDSVSLSLKEADKSLKRSFEEVAECSNATPSKCPRLDEVESSITESNVEVKQDSSKDISKSTDP